MSAASSMELTIMGEGPSMVAGRGSDCGDCDLWGCWDVDGDGGMAKAGGLSWRIVSGGGGLPRLEVNLIWLG